MSTTVGNMILAVVAAAPNVKSVPPNVKFDSPITPSPVALDVTRRLSPGVETNPEICPPVIPVSLLPFPTKADPVTPPLWSTVNNVSPPPTVDECFCILNFEVWSFIFFLHWASKNFEENLVPAEKHN